MNIEKPPVLSEGEKLTCSLVDDKHSYKELRVAIDEACVHQRDADAAWYEGRNNQFASDCKQLLDISVQQAKAEIAREIWKELEDLYRGHRLKGEFHRCFPHTIWRVFWDKFLKTEREQGGKN